MFALPLRRTQNNEVFPLRSAVQYMNEPIIVFVFIYMYLCEKYGYFVGDSICNVVYPTLALPGLLSSLLDGIIILNACLPTQSLAELQQANAIQYLTRYVCLQKFLLANCQHLPEFVNHL